MSEAKILFFTFQLGFPNKISFLKYIHIYFFEFPRQVTLYIGLKTNEKWAGELSDEETVSIVLKSHGPSGANTEYLYNLAEAMRRIDPRGDEYLFRIERKLREEEQKEKDVT